MIDPGETDTESSASIGPGDLSDDWEVELEVPPIKDYVGQEFKKTPVDKEDEYGCDIAIHIKEEGGSNGGGGGDGDEPQPSPRVAAATSSIPLPITLPRVGAWGAIIFASLGLVIVVTKYREK